MRTRPASPQVVLGFFPAGVGFLVGLQLFEYRLDVSCERIERQAAYVQVFLRNRHDVDPARDHGAVEPEKFPQKPLHPVAKRGVAGLLAHRQPEPPVRRLGWPDKHEKDEALGMEAPSPLVTIEELLALDQVKGPRKP